MTGRPISLSGSGPKLALALFAAVAVTLSVAAAALASATVSVSYDGNLRGEALFADSGDEFKICDERQDNLPVGVRYSYIRKDGKRQTGSHWHKVGVEGPGSPDSDGDRVAGCSYGDHDFAEGSRVWFQACVAHVGGTLTCSKTQVTSTGPK